MRKTIVLVFAIIMLITSAALLNENPVAVTGLAIPEQPAQKDDTSGLAAVEKGKLKLSFSETDFFYTNDIEVAITPSIPGAMIYYTTDGSEPTSADMVYSKPVRLSAKNTSVVVLKAIAVYEDTVTRPLVHTYFLGKGFAGRFDTLIFALSTNEDYLYDYDTGIFVEGRLRSDYIKENPREKIDPPAPANFNIRGAESERPVYVEVFTPEGERVVAQAAGLRVSGGWSRAADQKSLRLIARNEYDPGNGKFHYDFFPDAVVSDGYGTPLRKFDTLLLRNGANDREFGMLRNEVAVKLARNAGFNEATPVRAAAIFLNGEYYGFAWLEALINEQYLQDIYSAPTKDFDIVGDGDMWYNTENAALYESLVQMNNYAYLDLTDDAVFAELETLVDIDNLLFYYAYEMYMGNNDWPDNNLKRWRYTGPKTEGAAPELDGRWRFIMYDLDWTLGLYGDNHTIPTFKNVLGGSKDSPLLSALLKRSDMADRFVNILCDIASNVVSEETVTECIDELFSEAKNEISEAFADRKYSGWVSFNGVLDNHANMINFAKYRSDTVFKFMSERYGYGDMYNIEVTGGEAFLNTQKGTSARYFTSVNVPVSPALEKFEVFDYWIVNGKKVYERELSISGTDAVNGCVTLELAAHTELPVLAFYDAYSERSGNGCVLINLSEETASTEGLYISDSPYNPLLWELPSASVKSGKMLDIAGKGSSMADDLLKVMMPFRVKSGAALYLSDANGNILDYIIVP